MQRGGEVTYPGVAGLQGHDGLPVQPWRLSLTTYNVGKAANGRADIFRSPGRTGMRVDLRSSSLHQDAA